MLGEPYAALALEIIQRPAKHRRHQRSPAKMAVDAEIEQRAGLAGVEILERILVDVEIDLRRGAQNAIVDEIAPGNDDDRPAAGLSPVRHTGIKTIRRPHELRLDEVIDGVLGPAIDRRDPAGRSAAGRILQNVERLLDGLALTVCSH